MFYVIQVYRVIFDAMQKRPRGLKKSSEPLEKKLKIEEEATVLMEGEGDEFQDVQSLYENAVQAMCMVSFHSLGLCC